MVNHNVFNRIKDCMKLGLNKSETADKLGLDRKTVSRFWSMSLEEFTVWRKQASRRKRKFSLFQEEILKIYQLNGNQPLNKASVFDVLEERHGTLPGTERCLSDFILMLEQTGQLIYEAKPIRHYDPVPELPFGQQLQVDLGEYRQRDGRRWHIFAAVLANSRYKFALLQDRPFTTLDLIEALLQCFDFLGGMPRELAVDQDRLMVVRENYGDLVYTEQFKQFIDEMNLQMHVCRRSDPESKGKVEATVHYVKGNFFGARQFTNPEEANAALLAWLRRRANGRICEATGRIPSDVFETEKEHLRPAKSSVFRSTRPEERELRKVDPRSRIKVKGSTYPVPDEYRGRQVHVEIRPESIRVFDGKSGEALREHPRVAPGENAPDLVTEQLRGEKRQRRIDDLLSWHPQTDWQRFVEANRERYPRYLRDQYDYGNRHLRSGLDEEILQESLEYCLNNGSVSMADLHDAYRHFHTCKTRWQETKGQAMSVLLPGTRRLWQAPVVPVPDLMKYQTLLAGEGQVPK